PGFPLLLCPVRTSLATVGKQCLAGQACVLLVALPHGRQEGVLFLVHAYAIAHYSQSQEDAAMLGPSKPRRLDQPIAVSLEDLVPTDHFYRHLEAKLDLGFVRAWAQELYAE